MVSALKGSNISIFSLILEKYCSLNLDRKEKISYLQKVEKDIKGIKDREDINRFSDIKNYILKNLEQEIKKLVDEEKLLNGAVKKSSNNANYGSINNSNELAGNPSRTLNRIKPFGFFNLFKKKNDQTRLLNGGK